MFQNSITQLFGIQYPIIQGGMIWCSGWELASAVSNAGGLGLIGAGSMRPEVLKEHIQKCRANTSKPFGVNIPLLYPYSDEQIQMLIDEKIPVVFTSAGNPAKYTKLLKSYGIKVVHVTANLKFALKAQEAGVDAVVAEGFEAGGHNGREETTTLVLIPEIVNAVKIPVIAAGGIATGAAMMAAFALGAQGVQVGSRFVASVESSAHQSFKDAVVKAKAGDTMLRMRQLVPVRLLENPFDAAIASMEKAGASDTQLADFLGKGRARLGMFEGDMEEGELEIGQVSSLIDQIKPVSEIIEEMMNEFEVTKNRISKF